MDLPLLPRRLGQAAEAGRVSRAVNVDRYRDDARADAAVGGGVARECDAEGRAERAADRERAKAVPAKAVPPKKKRRLATKAARCHPMRQTPSQPYAEW